MSLTHYFPLTVAASGLSTDLTNFVGRINLTHADLRYTGSGGLVGKSDGSDIAIFTDAGLTTLSKFHLVGYNSATGAVSLRVKFPTYSHTASHALYLGFGDAAATSQADAAGTYDATFAAVYPGLVSGGTSLLDVTVNARHMTLNGTAPTTGVEGTTADPTFTFDGTTGYALLATPPFTVRPFSLSAWVNPASITGSPPFVALDTSLSASPDYELGLSSTAFARAKAIGNADCTTNAFVAGSWGYAGGVYLSSVSLQSFGGLGSGTFASSVVNTTSGVPTNPPDNMTLGARKTSAGVSTFNATTFGEVHVANVARSADWMQGEFAMFAAGTGWASVGARVDIGISAAAKRRYRRLCLGLEN